MTEPILFPNTHPLPRPTADNLPHILPQLLRVQSIERYPAAGGLVLNRATLFHDAATLRTEWTCLHPDIRITRGGLVSIRWSGRPMSVDGCVHIDRLVLMERPRPEVNLFQTVPMAWVKDRELLQRASTLWESLPRGFRHLLNSMFWDGRRFQRYLMGPSSLQNHHNDINGNFRHSVEVAEQAQSMARGRDRVHVPIAVLGGLIHDAGKADEYKFNRVLGHFEMSSDGCLVGHRDRLLHWIGAAMAAHRVIIPEAHYLGLLHALTATRGAPKWLGLREPRSLEPHAAPPPLTSERESP